MSVEKEITTIAADETRVSPEKAKSIESLEVSPENRPDYRGIGETRAENILKIIYPEIDSLDERQTLDAHAFLLMERTNQLRNEIESGSLGNMSSKEAFEYISTTHKGRNLAEMAISKFDPSLVSIHDESSDTVRAVALRELGVIGDKEGAKDFIGYGHEALRGVSMNYARGGGEFMMGVPQDILPDLYEEVHATIDKVVAETKKNPSDSMYRDEVVMFSCAVASYLDLIHPNVDLNGRSSEDWMVEIQRRMFEGDMSGVKTWSHSGLRAKKFPLSSIKNPDLRQEVTEMREGFVERTNHLTAFRSVLMEDTLSEILKNGVLEDGDKKLLELVMLANFGDDSVSRSELVRLVKGLDSDTIIDGLAPLELAVKDQVDSRINKILTKNSGCVKTVFSKAFLEISSSIQNPNRLSRFKKDNKGLMQLGRFLSQTRPYSYIYAHAGSDVAVNDWTEVLNETHRLGMERLNIGREKKSVEDETRADLEITLETTIDIIKNEGISIEERLSGIDQLLGSCGDVITALLNRERIFYDEVKSSSVSLSDKFSEPWYKALTNIRGSLKFILQLGSAVRYPEDPEKKEELKNFLNKNNNFEDFNKGAALIKQKFLEKMTQGVDMTTDLNSLSKASIEANVYLESSEAV